MLTCIAFCHRDAAAAANLLHWMYELDGQVKRHNLLLVAAVGLDPVLIRKVEEAGRDAYKNVLLVSTTRIDERPWPFAPNTMFRCSVNFIRKRFDCPFWWMEPDCIPLAPAWLDMLEDEYFAAGKPFMGCVVDRPCEHLTGCAIYPRDPGHYNPSMMRADRIAWDCVAPHLTLKHTHHTHLFHHQWSDPTDPTGRLVPTFPDRAKLSIIARHSVIFHRNKDHTLIDRLREERAERAGPDECVTVEVVAKESVVADSQPEKPAVAVELEPLPPAPPTSKLTHPVYAYHESIDGFFEQDVIDLWKESWSAWGWQPVLLGHADALKAATYKGFIKAVSALPTVNPPAYELACYKRWIALLARGGGLMTDYDVMNYGFTPEMAATDLATSPAALVFYEHRVPSAVLGGKDAFAFACQYLKAAVVGPKDIYSDRPHISDMIIMQRGWGKPWQRYIPRVVQWSEKGWQEALLVHYPNAKTSGPKPPKIRERYPFRQPPTTTP